MYDGSEECGDGQKESEEEDVAGCGAQHPVEGTAIECLQLAERLEMENEIDEHQRPPDAGIREKEKCHEGKDGGKDAKPKVDVLADFLAFFEAFLGTEFLDLSVDDANDDGAFSALLVLMAITVVIDHQQVVGCHAHCCGGYNQGDVPATVGHHIVSEDDGHKSEEDEHEEVTPP